MLHTRECVSGDAVYHNALNNLAEAHGYEDIHKFIASQANARNVLLYARDQGLPESGATFATLAIRRNRSLILLVLTIMVLQAKNQQAMVTQAIPAFLRVIGKAETVY
jgi:hypothetical protein